MENKRYYGIDVGGTSVKIGLFEGETLEILTPSAHFGEKIAVSGLKNADGERCDDAKLVQAVYSFDCPFALCEGDILRRKRA